MTGVTLGALSTGFLSDMLGRKPVIIMCLYVQAVLGACISIFIYSFPFYMTVRAIQGFFVQVLLMLNKNMYINYTIASVHCNHSCIKFSLLDAWYV